MDQASLSSQHSALIACCNEGEARSATLEAESKVWAREREEMVARTEAVRRDHERMAALQQRQEVELEELLDKHSQLRSNNRSLEAQHRELEARYKHTLAALNYTLEVKHIKFSLRQSFESFMYLCEDERPEKHKGTTHKPADTTSLKHTSYILHRHVLQVIFCVLGVNVVFTIPRYKEFLDGKTQMEEREREMKTEREEMASRGPEETGGDTRAGEAERRQPEVKNSVVSCIIFMRSDHSFLPLTLTAATFIWIQGTAALTRLLYMNYDKQHRHWFECKFTDRNIERHLMLRSHSEQNTQSKI